MFITPPPDTNDAELKEYWGQFGSVTDVFIPRGKNIAFITFASAQEQYSALAKGPHILKDFDMKAVEAKPKSSQGQSVRKVPRIFIGRIPPSVNDDHLRAYFGQFGGVSDLYRPKSNKNPESQIAFCIFEEDTSLYACLAAGSTHTVNDAPLSVTRAKPRPSDRAGAMSAQSSQPQMPMSAYSVQAYAQSMAPYEEYGRQSARGGRSSQQAAVMDPTSMAAYGQAAQYNPYAQQPQQGYTAEYTPRSRQRYTPY